MLTLHLFKATSYYYAEATVNDTVGVQSPLTKENVRVQKNHLPPSFVRPWHFSQRNHAAFKGN
jgi:hypothetical protein